PRHARHLGGVGPRRPGGRRRNGRRVPGLRRVPTAGPGAGRARRHSDLVQPVEVGLLAEEDVVELGEPVDGSRPGRTSPEQLTLYKSVGVAVQDATAATLVLAAARQAGLGRQLAL